MQGKHVELEFFSIFLFFKYLSGTIQELELLIEVDSILSLEKEKKMLVHLIIFVQRKSQ